MVKHSRDEHPQWYRLQVVESAANTYTEESIPTSLPINAGNGKMMVANLLKIFVHSKSGDMVNADEKGYSIHDREKTDLESYDSAGVLVRDTVNSILTVEGANILNNTRVYDLSDGNGHGVLFAKERIFFGIRGIGQGAALSAEFGILFTLKEVTAEELIGIISSG